MNKILCKILSCFIIDKNDRHKFRKICNKIINEDGDLILESKNNIKIDQTNLSLKNKKSFNNKILLITHTNFLKNNAGNNAYIFNIAKILKKLDFTIDFLTMNNFILHDFDNFNVLNKKYNLINNFYLLDKENYTSNNYLYSHNSWVNDQFIEYFQNIISKNKYSYILSNYIEMTDLFRFTKINNKTKIINIMHDCSTMQCFFNDNNYDEIGINFENEIKLLQYYDDILCISNDEKYIFEKFYKNKNFYWLPYFNEFKKNNICNKEIDCLFTGYNNIYNFNSIIWFCEKVYPLINQKINLTICGKVGDMIKEQKPDIYEKMLENNVKFLGFVENLDELYSKTKIAIVPMFNGTGLKVKTITAMSYGVPIVGTYAAIDGFADKNENPCLITNNEVEFAKYINILLNDKNFYNQKSKEIEIYFKKYFSVDKAKMTIKNIFKRL